MRSETQKKTDSSARPRLETDRTLGYRHGMLTGDFIGRRLAAVYKVSNDVPEVFGRVLKSVEAPTRD